ncbi:hypothetical protein [Sphingomonas sp. URHD0057]|uniref:hypothetical protein n=1 Tax=Sphingomonas sp. URHD0057 TaxID=1380389 RepID=UPI00048FBF51|nr:hypothetical protein [Sphingomonas sp. URHD0057]
MYRHPLLLSRRTVLALIGGTAAAVAVPLAAAKLLTLDEVVRRNTRARGGAAALDRMHSLLMDVEIDEAGQKLDGRYAANTAGLVKVDIYVGDKFAGAEGIDSAGVWTWGKNGPEPSVAAGAANALQHGAEDKLYGWHRFAQRGHTLTMMPPETIDGTTYQLVQVRYSTGHVSNFYVDPKTWQAVRRRDERAFHPDVDQTQQKVETRYSDFRSVAGVIAPHRDTDYDLATGKVLARHPVLQRQVNPTLAPDYFDRNRRAPATW